jgi:hypothetical protein
MQSTVYRFERQPPNEVYNATTFGNSIFTNKDKMIKNTLGCLSFLFLFLFMGSFIFSLTHVPDHEIGYYKNTESDKIIYPGLHFNLVWNYDKPRFVRTVDTLIIPISLYDSGDSINTDITVDYKATNITQFVKAIKKNENVCNFEIETLVYNISMKNTSCLYFSLHEQIYTITPLINTTIDICGITITNVTFPKQSETWCNTSRSDIGGGNTSANINGLIRIDNLTTEKSSTLEGSSIEGSAEGFTETKILDDYDENN